MHRFSPCFAAAPVVLLDRLPARAVPERHRVAAVGVLERGRRAGRRRASGCRPGPRRGGSRARSRARGAASGGSGRRATAPCSTSVDALALAREDRRGGEAGRAGADHDDVGLHVPCAGVPMIATVSGWRAAQQLEDVAVGVLAVDELRAVVPAARAASPGTACGRPRPRPARRARHVVDGDGEVHLPDRAWSAGGIGWEGSWNSHSSSAFASNATWRR